ncbi:MAG: MarR family transcriptional regulator [Alphaproteobacteria bacterium]|nr:MarR family transcriptional regulator [Alphaproteobacteria bacterium]
MAHKEYAYLLLQNVAILDRLSNHIKKSSALAKKSKQLFEVLVRLKLAGRTSLKDMVAQSYMSAANISTTVKHLESEGLVMRETCKCDRRNVWYSLTPDGARAASDAIDKFLGRITDMAAGLSASDEKRLTAGLMTVNEVLEKIKDKQ